MSVELGCLDNSKDLAWGRSPIGGFAVPCGSPANESFGGSYDQDTERSKLKTGQRVPVRITAPVGDTWQLWITVGPAPVWINSAPPPSHKPRHPASQTGHWHQSLGDITKSCWSTRSSRPKIASRTCGPGAAW
jgi:hypothetical protein